MELTMVEKTYTINQNNVSRTLLDWIKGTTGFTTIFGNGRNREMVFKIDHSTPTEEELFQSELSKRLGVNIDGINVDTALITQELQTDIPLLTITPRLSIPSLSTTFQDVFPSTLYDGFPIPIHTLGYKKMGFVLLWNKNGGTSNHDIRIVKSDNTGSLLPNVSTPDILISANNVASDRTFTFDSDIPNEFMNYRGFVKIQAKSGNGTDSPILDGLFIYLIRGGI